MHYPMSMKKAKELAYFMALMTNIPFRAEVNQYLTANCQ